MVVGAIDKAKVVGGSGGLMDRWNNESQGDETQ